MRPNVYYSDPAVTLWHGDSIDTMRELPDNSIDSIVTDPPYGLGFMGQKWDALPPGEEWAAECLRVLKPGGHLLAFGGSRTWHRLAVAVEDAGFEIRDSIAWLYGSGFPKSLDVSKAIDKAAGAERTEVVGVKAGHEDFVGRDHVKGFRESATVGGAGGYSRPWMQDEAKVQAAHYDMAPATEAAAEWQGWGTALKPAFEPVVVGRKPLIGTVAANVQRYGTGALNIDASRISTDETLGRFNHAKPEAHRVADSHPNAKNLGRLQQVDALIDNSRGLGRWPANVVLDETTAPLLDQQSGNSKSSNHVRHNTAEAHNKTTSMHSSAADWTTRGTQDEGGASRFFYVAKAPKRERPVVDGVAHPTVKPLALMRWLVKLVTPPGGVVLDPFEGSGTTLEACLLEGFNHVGIEREADYLPLIMSRIDRQAGTLDVAA